MSDADVWFAVVCLVFLLTMMGLYFGFILPLEWRLMKLEEEAARELEESVFGAAGDVDGRLKEG